MKNITRLITFLVILPLIFTSIIFIAPVTAHADSLIIQGDGAIILIEGDDVLGTSLADNTKTPTTVSPATPSKPAPPPPPTSTPPKPAESTPIKQVPITPPNTSSVIKAAPSPSNNKIQVTISTKSTSSLKPSSPSTTGSNTSNKQSSSAPSTSPSTVTTNVINKDVNRVILEGQPNQPILTITSAPNASPNTSPKPTSSPGENVPTSSPLLVIQQGSTQLSTALPLQLDTSNHSVSAVLSTGPTKLNVLPQEAVQGVINNKLVNNITSVSTAPKITLEESNNQPIYKVEGQKSGKLFGIFSVSTPVEVRLSAQTGNVVGVNQSLTFRLFGLFIH